MTGEDGGVLPSTWTLHMFLKSIRRMRGLCCDGGWWRWTHHFLLVIWLSLFAAAPPKAQGYFLGDTKAVLNGCEDHWTLQDRAAMPMLFQMTLCVDIRVVVPGAWVAFSYSSVHAPRPELGLEGDEEALYGWLLRVRHRFPIQLSPKHWHRVCLRRDVLRNSFSLEVDGTTVAERTVIARAIPPTGSLWLGCRPRDRPPGATLGQVELYLFRMWADLDRHEPCEDGTVIGWNTQHWGVTSPRARERNPSLQCAGPQPGAGRLFTPPPVSSTTTTSSPVIATSATHMSNQTPDITVSSSTGNTVSSSPTEPPSVTPSANHSKVENPSDLQNSSATASTNVTSTMTPTPENPTTSDWTSSNTSDPPFTALPVSDTSTQTSPNSTIDRTTPGGTLTSGSPLVDCDLSQLCSNNSAYYWMSISVQTGGHGTEQYVHNLVSKAFGCHGVQDDGVNSAIDFCQSDRKLQAVQVNCSRSSNDRLTSCEVLLQLSGAVSECELQRAGASALQQAGAQQREATITGEVERVGRGVCGGVEPSSGGFVRCTSSSSLDDVCRTNNLSDLTCSPLELNSRPAPLKRPQSCSSEAPRFCDCSSFCNSSSQFFTIRLNISSSSVNINTLKELLSGPSVARWCNTSQSVCQDILKRYQHAHLECHGTQQRLYSCMVILEMSGPVSSCSLDEFLQQVIAATPDITSERPLTRMVVCGPPGSTVRTLLASNLTWVDSDLLTSDVCRPHPPLLRCEANESLAVLLSDSCPAGEPILEQQRNTSSPSGNMTTSAPQVNVTLNSVTTATRNSTVDNVTSAVDNTTKPAAALFINQSGDPTTETASTVNLTTTAANATQEASTTTKPDTGTTSTSETTISQEVLQELADRLLNQTQDVSQLNSSQVEQLVSELEKLLDGPNVSREVGQRVVGVISNLMEADPQALSTSSRRLVRLVDDLGLKLVVTGDKEVLSSSSLVLAVGVVDGTNFPMTTVDIFNTDNVQLRALGTSRSQRSGSALGSVFLPSSLTMGLSPEQQRQASRVQFNFYTTSILFKDTSSFNETVVSPVLAASVANLSISNLTENILYTIRNTNPAPENFTASCAFWDVTQNGGGGGWGHAGCFVVNATMEETTCSCNHLTSFAILLDLSREGLVDRQNAQILTYISYIGCGISVIFLAVTLLTYLSFDKLRRDIPAKILVQLCLSLLLLNLIFLLDGWLALYPAIGLCISTAFFLHYFLLTSFTWAGLEALHMYLSIVRVFTPYLSRYMLKFSLVGWGIPLIVVIIIISVDKDNYGLVTYGRFTDGTTDDFCWLRNDIAFYVGVVAYFLLVFIMCLLVFIVVMVQLYRIKKQNPHNQCPNRGMMTDMRSIVGLIVLLGLTWGFALFAWGPLYLPFVYLFSIFNSLQGFFVFVFHCAVKESVRRQWRIYLCCGRLRLAENTEWSRTATQRRNRTFSDVTATSSAPQLASRSVSVTSDVTNSSDSVFADSGISEGSSSFLSDIHRRTVTPVSSILQ